MRLRAAILALVALVSMSGCMGMETSPEGTGDHDPEFPVVLLSIALLVGIVLLVVNLSARDRGGAPPRPPPSPPSTGPVGPERADWQALDEAEAQPAGPVAPSRAPKPRRRAP